MTKAIPDRTAPAHRYQFRYRIAYRLPVSGREIITTVDAKTLKTLKKQGRLARIISKKAIR